MNQPISPSIPTSMLTAALSYGKKGWSVFPVVPSQKKPLTEHGVLDATRDPSTIRAWWKRWPDANIGIACGPSHLIAIDLDVKGGDGPGAWWDLCQQHDIDDSGALEQRTPSGGIHKIFKSDGSQIKNSVGKLAPGVDVRAGNGYVLVAPSKTAAGPYVWEVSAHPDDREPGVLPPALSKLLAMGNPWQAAASPKATQGIPLTDAIPRGQRNQALASLAGSMRRRGMSRDAILAALLVVNEERCDPPLSPAEVTAIADSINRYAPTQPGLPGAKPPAATITPPRGTTRIGEYVHALTTLGYAFALNEAGQMIECNGRRMDEFVFRTIRARMRELGFKNSQGVEDVIYMQAKQNRYHPIQRYLVNAAVDYDGQNHIARLASYFTDGTEPHHVFATWLQKWLIGAVAKAMDGSRNQNMMLVIDGPQDVGKSYFAHWLCSQLPDYFLESAIDTNQKDIWIRLMSKWIWEVSELGATTRKADVDALKAFITTQIVTVRKPYDRQDTIGVALASMIGTINDDAGFLIDRTGNRRYWIARVEAINWAYADDIDVGQMWGEAAAAFARGESWRLEPHEKLLAEETSDQYKVPNVTEGYLLKYFEIDPDDTTAWMPTSEIVERLQAMGLKFGSPRTLAMDVASTLRGMGITKQKRRWGGRPIWGYIGVRRNAP